MKRNQKSPRAADAEELDALEEIIEKGFRPKKAAEDDYDEDEEMDEGTTEDELADESDEDEEEKESDDESEEDEEEDEDEEDEDEDIPPIRRGAFSRKSLADRVHEDEETAQALEVSEFLARLTDYISDTIEDGFAAMHKSIAARLKRIESSLDEMDPVVIAKSVRAEIIGDLEDQQSLVKSLMEGIEQLGKTPLPPRSVVGGTQGVLQKGGVSGQVAYSAEQKMRILLEASKAGILPDPNLVTKAEIAPGAVPDALIKSLSDQLSVGRQA